MPLIECPDCKKQISDAAPTCPGCGRPMTALPAEGIDSETPKVCPECGKRALRYRKRTRDYSCKQCPFEGDASKIQIVLEMKQRQKADMERAAAIEPYERAVSKLLICVNANRDAIRAPLAPEPGQGLLPSVTALVFAAAVTALGAIIGLFGFGIGFAAFIVSFFVAYAGLAFAAARRNAARQPERQAAFEQVWARKNAALLTFRQRSAERNDLSNPALLESMLSFSMSIASTTVPKPTLEEVELLRKGPPLLAGPVRTPLRLYGRKPPSREEQESANRELLCTFPRDVAQALIKSKVHPDDARQMVDTFHTAREQAQRMPEGGVPEFLEKASRIYQTDPSKPPETGWNAEGQEVPWDQLNPGEQAEAMVQHRNKILAMSMAARAHTADLMARSFKASPALAAKLADFTLRNPEGETQVQRQQRAAAMAQEMFRAALDSGEEPEEITDGEIQRTIKMLGTTDPASQTVAVGFFQARDYQLMRKKFLSATSEDAISEFDSPDQIHQGIEKAVKYMQDRETMYPKGTANQNTADVVRNWLLDHLRSVNPDKFPEVRKLAERSRPRT